MDGALKLLSSTVIVAGAVIGYIPQYLEIAKTQNEEGFSTGVSFILLVANIMRVFFWFGKSFELTLLYQSIAVISCQLALLHLCIRVRNARHHDGRRKYFTDYDLASFWNWADMESYVQCLLCLSTALLALGVTFGSSQWYVEGLGSVALGVECTLALPQAYKNHISKSTTGLNTLLIVGWLVGDVYKTLYFHITSAPVQFLYSGAFQVVTDAYILLQMFVLYREPPRKATLDRDTLV